MSNVPTPHIEAHEGEIAKTVLMPGDPLRAKFIAENFLTNVKCFNKVRGMLGFTGEYSGKKVSIMGAGMGMPSLGIYTYELFNFYNVENIIRTGSAGTFCKEVPLRSIIAAMGACTDSNYAHQFNLPGTFAPIASYDLLSSAVENAKVNGFHVTVGNVLSSDVFYSDSSFNEKWTSMGVLAVEMEAAALYMNAAKAKKNALCLLTVSDSLVTGESLSSEERATGFSDMAKLALSLV